MQRIGKQIEMLRTRLGMSQGDLAEQTHLSHSYVSNLEQGKEMPDLDVLLRIAVILRAEPWQMLLSTDSENASRPALLDEPPVPHLH